MTSDLQRIQSLPTWLVGRVAARGRGMVADAIAAEGLKLMHHAVLAATAEYGPVTQADLARRLAVDPKDMVGILNHLQKEGLVLRAPTPRTAARTPSPPPRRAQPSSPAAEPWPKPPMPHCWHHSLRMSRSS